MMARLEALDAASGGMLTNDVFALIAPFVRWYRQPLAFDWHETLKLCVPASFDGDRDAARRGDQVNLPALIMLIGLLDLELKDVPTRRVPSDAVEVGAKLRRENRLGRLSWSVRAVTPVR